MAQSRPNLPAARTRDRVIETKARTEIISREQLVQVTLHYGVTVDLLKLEQELGGKPTKADIETAANNSVVKHHYSLAEYCLGPVMENTRTLRKAGT